MPLFGRKKNVAAEPLPGFLVKPDDPISMRMYGSSLVEVTNVRCYYHLQVNPEYQEKVPVVREKSTKFEVDEVHIYSKPGIPSWYAVHTMKTPMVKTTPLEGYVMHPYQLSKAMSMPELFLTLPGGLSAASYEDIRLDKLGSWPAYNSPPRRLDESCVYANVFRLNGVMYQKFILCARKDKYAWMVESYAESTTGSAEISAADFVVPGFLFGGFRPL